MNCAVVTPNRYGIREVAERVGNEWEQAGHNVKYIFSRGQAARIGPLTIGVPGIARWWDRTLQDLAERSEEYDLIWTHQPIAPRLPTQKPDFWNKVVVTFHTTFRREYELVREGIYPRHLLPYYWLAKTLEGRFYRQVQSLDTLGPHYTVIAPHLAEEIAPFNIDRHDIALIPNGLATPDPQEYRSIRDEYDIPPDATLVFNIGSLTPQKRPVEFARTMRTVTDSNEDIYCVMAGKGPLADEIQSFASNQLVVPGYVSDNEKWRWFAESDVFGSLSAYEGMPVATLEALAFGVPVFLSDIPSHRNVIKRHETTGDLVELEPSAVTAAIRSLATKSATVSLPDWSNVATEYLQLMGQPSSVTWLSSQ